MNRRFETCPWSFESRNPRAERRGVVSLQDRLDPRRTPADSKHPDWVRPAARYAMRAQPKVSTVRATARTRQKTNFLSRNTPVRFSPWVSGLNGWGSPPAPVLDSRRGRVELSSVTNDTRLHGMLLSMSSHREVQAWLREQCSEYHFDLAGVFRNRGDISWPVVAKDETELGTILAAGGHILPLPKESAALANVLEVSLVDFLLERAQQTEGVKAERGTERGYPDLELSGDVFGGGFHAVDIKMARRGVTKGGKLKSSTQSRVTLYTGNTYFRYPKLHWPGTFRPFQDYETHLDIVGIYTLNEVSAARVDDLELIVQPPWKIASKQRSSTTREYIGAVQSIEALREGRGDFETAEEFYTFWRKHPFKIGRAVQQQLDKLLNT